MLSMSPVLIVEDNELVRRLIKQQCAQLGYPTREAGSGEEALEIISHEALSALVLDINLPGHSGLQFAQLVRTVEREGPVPIFIFTGVPLSTLDEVLARKLHAAVFHKPGELRALIDAIDCYLNPASPVSGLSDYQPKPLPGDASFDIVDVIPMAPEGEA